MDRNELEALRVQAHEISARSTELVNESEMLLTAFERRLHISSECLEESTKCIFKTDAAMREQSRNWPEFLQANEHHE